MDSSGIQSQSVAVRLFRVTHGNVMKGSYGLRRLRRAVCVAWRDKIIRQPTETAKPRFNCEIETSTRYTTVL